MSGEAHANEAPVSSGPASGADTRGDRADATPRPWLVLAPLAAALLLATALLWSRSAADQHRPFCTRATQEVTRILRLSDGSIRPEYDRAEQLRGAFELAHLVEPANLIAGAPSELRPKLERAAELLPAYRRARADALAAGEPVPALPDEVADALASFLATYTRDCLSRA